MSFLEDKIKTNREFFDDREPAEGHRIRFVQKLASGEKEEPAIHRWNERFRLAAMVAAIVAVAFFIYKYRIENIGNAIARNVIQIHFSDEIENAFHYYESLTDMKLAQINHVATDTAQAAYIHSVAAQQIETLDARLAEIKKEYAKNPNDKRLQAALINSKRKKAEVVDRIIRHVDGAKNTSAETQGTNP